MLGDAEAVREAWAAAMRRVWLAAKAERMRELRGDYSVKRFDSRGLHTFTYEWAQVEAFEALVSGLSELRLNSEPELTPVSVRKLAARAAEQDFAEELRSGAEGVFA